jgi:hypothetical protein
VSESVLLGRATGTFVLAMLVATGIASLTGCGTRHVARQPPLPPRRPCPVVGEVSSREDLAALRAIFASRHRDLVVSESGLVFEIPCSHLRLGGSSETSQTNGKSEKSGLAGRSEGAKIAGADEHSRVEAGGEKSQVATAGEASTMKSEAESSKLRHSGEKSDLNAAAETSRLGHAGEDSALNSGSTRLFCRQVGRDQYQIISESTNANVLVFDGAVLVKPAPDGVVR